MKSVDGVNGRPRKKKRVTFSAIPRSKRRKFSMGVLHPSGPFCKRWEAFRTCLLVYSFFIIPFRIAFTETRVSTSAYQNGSSFVFDVLVDSCFLIDLVLPFNVAVVQQGGATIENRRKIASIYLRSSDLFLRLCSVQFPVYILHFLGASTLSLQLARMPSLIRLISLARYFHDLERDYHSDVRLAEMCKFLLIIFGSGHWCGCIWYCLADWAGFSRLTWLEIYEESEVEPGFLVDLASTFQLYLRSVYWGFSGIASLGYGNQIPLTHVELIFSTIVTFCAGLIQSYMITIVVQHLIKTDPKVEAFRSKMQALERYITAKRLPNTLAEQMRAYFKLQSTLPNSELSALFSDFPEHLRIKIAAFLFRKVVDAADVLCACTDAFLDALCLRLTPMIVLHGDILVRENDGARDLMFVVDGELEILHEGQFVTSQSVGVVGELSFFLGIRQPFSVRACISNNVHLVAMKKAEYEALIGNFPEQHDKIVTNLLGKYNMRSLGEAFLSKDKADMIMSGQRTGKGNTAMDAHQERIKSMIQAEMESTREEQLSALVYAASKGELDEVKRLVLRGLDPNYGDYDRRTVMHLAATEGNMKVVEFLISHGADVKVKDRWNHTPLHDAITYKHDAIAQLLVSKGASLPRQDASLACQKAASTGDVRQLTRLIENGVDPNIGDYDGRTALHLAASSGQLSAVQYLISVKANISPLDRWGGTPLLDAIRNNHSLVARLLKEHGGVVLLENASSEMCAAASAGNSLKLKLLVLCGVDVDSGDYDFRTALHLAASEGQLEAVDTLLNLKANANAVDRFGGTALDDATRKNNDHVAALIRAHGGLTGEQIRIWEKAYPEDDHGNFLKHLTDAKRILSDGAKKAEEARRQKDYEDSIQRRVNKVIDLQRRTMSLMELAPKVLSKRRSDAMVEAVLKRLGDLGEVIKVYDTELQNRVAAENVLKKRLARAVSSSLRSQSFRRITSSINSAMGLPTGGSVSKMNLQHVGSELIKAMRRRSISAPNLCHPLPHKASSASMSEHEGSVGGGDHDVVSLSRLGSTLSEQQDLQRVGSTFSLVNQHPPHPSPQPSPIVVGPGPKAPTPHESCSSIATSTTSGASVSRLVADLSNTLNPSLQAAAPVSSHRRHSMSLSLSLDLEKVSDDAANPNQRPKPSQSPTASPPGSSAAPRRTASLPT